MKKLFWILGIMVAFTGCVKEDVRNKDIIQIETENVFDDKAENEVAEPEIKPEQKEIEVESKKEEPVPSIKPSDGNEIKKEEPVPEKEIEEKKEESKIIAIEGHEVGNKAIDFEVELLNGEKVKLSDYYGKPIFLNFWATWCGPCVREMPHIQEVSEEYADKIIVLAINISDSSDDVKTFVDNAKYTFNFGLNESGSLLDKYNSYSIPLSVFIDKDGIIKERHIGSMTKDMMVKIIEGI